MDHRTKLYEQIETRLGEPLADYVISRRTPEPLRRQTSWRRIAMEITARTGIEITGEALRVWFAVRTRDEAVA